METQEKNGWNTLIGWNPGYAIGNAHLDGQHRHLVGLLVNLKDFLVENGLHAEAADFENIVNSLADYTRLHFSSEQALMAKHSYAGLDGHVQLHAVFIQAVNAFSVTVKSGKTADLHDLYDFLFYWLIDHILQEDRKFAVYLQEKGIH